ncbi:MAG: YgiT-type zinc finger protein [Sporolactobacillus sp.]
MGTRKITVQNIPHFYCSRCNKAYYDSNLSAFTNLLFSLLHHKIPHLFMIRFILNDFEGSVDLLDKDQAHELVRKGKF